MKTPNRIEMNAEKANEIISKGMPQPHQVFEYDDWLRANTYLAVLRRSPEVRELVASVEGVGLETLRKLLEDTHWMLAVSSPALEEILIRLEGIREALSKFRQAIKGEGKDE